jgi:hypothetical protein
MKKNILKQFYIYQLNTRIFCLENHSKLSTLFSQVLDTSEVMAADAVWLMGIWKPSPLSVEICKKHEGLNHEFSKALPDITDSDIIGSPYSIYEYSTNPIIADHKIEIKQFKYKLNSIGKKLILDFVPNHMSIDSPLIDKYPEYFLYKKEENPKVCKNSFQHKNGKIYYYGKDPYYDGWTDTIQWDFSHPEVVNLHIQIIKDISEICDGIRCDMAMLPLEDIFEKTHGIKAFPYWEKIISEVKKEFTEFLFIAEVYWNLEFRLQSLGFDYTYDKTLYDRLKQENPKELYLHLQAEESFQNKSLRFLENHDEERALKTFAYESKSYFSLLCFLNGSILYHEGQSNGYEIKIPVQLGRRVKEKNFDISYFYSRALYVIQNRKNAEVSYYETKLHSFSNNTTTEYSIIKILAYLNKIEILILNPYSNQITGKMFLPEEVLEKIKSINSDVLVFKDIVDNMEYKRYKVELLNEIYIQLRPKQAHWFLIEE